MSNNDNNNYYYQANSESPEVTTSDGTKIVDNPLFDNPEKSLIIATITLIFLIILLLILCKFRFGSNNVGPVSSNQQADGNVGRRWPMLGPRPKVQSELSENQTYPRSLSTKSLSTTSPILQTSKVVGLSSNISQGPSSTLNQFRIKSSAFIQKLVNWKADRLDVTSKCPEKFNSIKVDETITRRTESPKCEEIITLLPIVSPNKIIPQVTLKVIPIVEKKSNQVSKIKVTSQTKANLSTKKRSSSSSSASFKSKSSKSTSPPRISMEQKQRPKQKSRKSKSYSKKMIGRIGNLN